MTELFSLYAILFVLTMLYMLAWFVVSVVIKRNDVADIAWGIGFVLVAVVSLVLGDTESARSLLATGLVAVWGLRLSTHIYLRIRGKDEDPRYRKWRQEWGRWFYPRSFFQVFILQGLLLLLVVSPVVFVNTFAGGPLGVAAVIGALIWLVGFGFEVVGDRQLRRFLADPANKGKVLQSGLWRYTRHPNYFGEVTQWWGLWCIALAVPYGWISVIGPAAITVLILYVSGIPMLEKKMAGNPAFEEYKQRVSTFIPMPPKRAADDR